MRASARILLLLAPGLLLLATAGPQEESVDAAPAAEAATLRQAERLFLEGSFARAHDLYRELDSQDLHGEEARWIDFRLADSLWRSQAATRTSDTTEIDRARNALESLIRSVTRPEDRDLLWAEVQESLGDFWWARRDSRNWGQGFNHYQLALDWWAGARDVESARRRYLGMVWRMAQPPEAQPHYYYGYYGNHMPLEILENALEISTTDTDRAHAHYLIAMTLVRQGGEIRQRRRIPAAFEAALEGGPATGWYDDALYHYAEWHRSPGPLLALESGGWGNKPDFVGAVGLYRRILTEYRKGDTRYYDQAASQIESITHARVGVTVSNIFLPASEIEYYLSWRNVERVQLALYRVDLTEDLGFRGEDTGSGSWLQRIDVSGRTPARSWDHGTDDDGKHHPGQAALRVEPTLPAGAYVLEATAGNESARELVLVTDAAIVLKGAPDRALAYVADALDGSPLQNADVVLWERYHDSSQWVWREHRSRSDESGLATFELTPTDHPGRDLLVTAALGARQALAPGRTGGYGTQPAGWRIHAFTDRPAYRPGETVQWKLVARQHDGAVYSVPSDTTLEYRIDDPRGTKVDEGKAKLNGFGSAWGSLELTGDLPLGEYHVQFWAGEPRRHIGNATLFRLEEYKLPEFQVSVRTPEEEGKRRSFRLGETVEVEIEAQYYFGGPVADATVEILVHQNPFHHWWMPPRPYPWLYEDLMPRPWGYYGGNGPIVKRETVKTDASGRAVLSFDTPEGSGQDFEYRVEARVTDSSRREVIGSDAVRVTRQRYYVHPRPRHNLYRPGDDVTVDFKAVDANDQPVRTTGTVTVTRDHWYEIWLDPDGNEVRGERLREIREKAAVFPPPSLPSSPPGRPGWQLKFRGYEHDEILSRSVRTDADGNAELTFAPEREGYYRVSWSSREDDGTTIQAETTAWIATASSRDLGYRHGGVQILVDRDTFRAGDTAPVMLSVPTNDRYVLFTMEAENLLHHQVVHVPGMVKLLELPIGEEHVPNVFLSAVLLTDGQMFLDMEQVVVPPVRQFLDVEVLYDRAEYEPREEGSVTLVTTDHEGRPVSAEVSLGLIDESVYYIQDDYAGDPRRFFYGSKRAHQVQTSSTLQLKPYRKLEVGEDDRLVDARIDTLGSRDGDFVGGAHGDDAGRKRDGAAKAAGMILAEGMASNRAMSRSELAADEARELPMAQPPAPSGAGGTEPAVQVRSDFRSTMFWQPDVVTGADGRATVQVKFPDSLTGWNATARAVALGNQFGQGAETARTRMPLIIRLQAPRFFVVGDRTTLSAVINNNTGEAMRVTPSLVAEGLEILVDGARPLEVPGGGESRVDWVVTAPAAGEAKLTVEARGAEHADAMQQTYGIHEHGIEKFLALAGKMRGDELTATLDLPSARAPGSTSMTVQLAPSMAVTMLDALPYLIDYPYGCTEQTMSRFLPAAITAKTLRDLGLSPESAMATVFGGIEREHAESTHPDGARSLDELDRMVRQGLDRLYGFQHSDGGWGWWKEGESDHFMTAYVVWGLTLARQADIDIRGGVLDRGVRFLVEEIVEEEERLDMQAWMLHALAAHRHSRRGSRASGHSGSPGSDPERTAFENLWTKRASLNAYSRALLALSAHHYGDAERAHTLIRNLENGAILDRSPDTSVVQRGAQTSSDAVQGTAHWGEDGLYRRWSEGGVEATATALRALMTIEPGNALVEPVTNWLVKNRRGAQWSNTRDTAMVVLALNDYLVESGELVADLEYELLVNGRSIARQRITPEDVLDAPSRYPIDPALVRDGENEIRFVRRDGEGPLYFAVEATFFSREEPITPAGNEIFVRRQYYKMVGRPTLLKGYVYEKVPLNDGETVTSGERVEAVITIEAKNNYEYLVFEDLKPAGLEAVQIRSGEPLYAQQLKSGAVTDRFSPPAEEAERSVTGSDHTGRTRWVYQELRDRKVALFLDRLPQGVWEIRYELRAEVPGAFHALPVLGHAMYVPEIRCNGREVRITVEDRPESGASR